MRPRPCRGYVRVRGSDGHWTIKFALQGSFECPTPHMNFDLKHQLSSERMNDTEFTTIQPCLEGRWHVYHIAIEGREDDMKVLEEEHKRLGGPVYDWRMTMLLHESRPLDRRLVDMVMDWQSSSSEHPRWFGVHRENRQRRAFYVDKDDWSNIKRIRPTAHDMIFIGHPDQCIEEIASVCADRAKHLQKTTKGACKSCPCEAGGPCMEQVFNNGCLLPNAGNVFAIKDDYGFVLVMSGRS